MPSSSSVVGLWEASGSGCLKSQGLKPKRQPRFTHSNEGARWHPRTAQLRCDVVVVVVIAAAVVVVVVVRSSSRRSSSGSSSSSSSK